MLKNVIGAAIGSHVTKKPATGGAIGAAIATAVPFVLSRFSLPTMAALGVGGYLTKRYFDKKQAEENTATAKKLTGADLSKPAKAPKADTGSVINPPPGGAIAAPVKANGMGTQV